MSPRAPGPQARVGSQGSQGSGPAGPGGLAPPWSTFCPSTSMFRRPTSGSSSSSPPRTWGNSMLGTNQLLPMCLMPPLIQLTHPDPPKLSDLPPGTCPNGAAQEEGMAGPRCHSPRRGDRCRALSRAHSCEARARETQPTLDQHGFACTGPPVHRCCFSINIRSALLIPGLTSSGSSSISPLWLGTHNTNAGELCAPAATALRHLIEGTCIFEDSGNHGLLDPIPVDTERL